MPPTIYLLPLVLVVNASVHHISDPALCLIRGASEAGEESRRPRISSELWTQPIEQLPEGGSDFHDLVFKHLELVSNPGGTATVFSLEDNPNKMLVYRYACVEPGEIEPAVRDFWFLSFLKHSGVVPQVFTMSQGMDPRTFVDLTVSGGKVNAWALEHCKTNVSVRYIFMERAPGHTIDGVARAYRNRVPVYIATRWGVTMLEALQVLHSYNVVHGDVHSRNIIVQPEDWTVRFIDFEQATFSVSKENRPEPPNSAASIYIRSFRQDVFRMLIITGNMIFGSLFEAYIYRLVDGKHSLNAPWLVRELELREDVKSLVMQRLTRMAHEVAQMDVWETPDYEGLIRQMHEISQST